MAMTGKEIQALLVKNAEEICVSNDVERIPCAQAFIEVFGEDVR